MHFRGSKLNDICLVRSGFTQPHVVDPSRTCVGPSPVARKGSKHIPKKVHTGYPVDWTDFPAPTSRRSSNRHPARLTTNICENVRGGKTGGLYLSVR